MKGKEYMNISKSMYIEGINYQDNVSQEIPKNENNLEIEIGAKKYLENLEQKLVTILKEYSEILSNEDKEIVRSMLALILADLQFQADFYYYIQDDNNLSSSKLEIYQYLKKACKIFGISGEDIENEALSIYDFKNSGSSDYIPPNYILETLRSAKSIF